MDSNEPSEKVDELLDEVALPNDLSDTAFFTAMRMYEEQQAITKEKPRDITVHEQDEIRKTSGKYPIASEILHRNLVKARLMYERNPLINEKNYNEKQNFKILEESIFRALDNSVWTAINEKK